MQTRGAGEKGNRLPLFVVIVSGAATSWPRPLCSISRRAGVRPERSVTTPPEGNPGRVMEGAPALGDCRW